MTPRVRSPLAPMELTAADSLPTGGGWQYEPKWDGFRALIFREGSKVVIQSKRQQPLGRYFPELCDAMRALPADQFVLDGEIVVPVGSSTSFDALLERIHPAASRVAKLAAERPAMFIAFDLLLEGDEILIDVPLEERRTRLEKFARRVFRGSERLALSPATQRLDDAKRWFAITNGGLDGVVAKRLDRGYAAGERGTAIKVKHRRTADCVVGGYRVSAGGKGVGSLLLGLYDDDGLLQHIGHAAGFTSKERTNLSRLLAPLKTTPAESFTGRAPGGPSRWNKGRSGAWIPVRPELVVEVEYDQFNGDRFRHGTGFVRTRPDKAPEQCTFEQVRPTGGTALRLVEQSGGRKSKSKTDEPKSKSGEPKSKSGEPKSKSKSDEPKGKSKSDEPKGKGKAKAKEPKGKERAREGSAKVSAGSASGAAGAHHGARRPARSRTGAPRRPSPRAGAARRG